MVDEPKKPAGTIAMNLFMSALLWFAYGLSFLISFLIALPAYVLTYPFDPHRKICNWLFMFFGQSMVTLNPGWRRTITGAEHYRPDVPTIVVANHLSFLDMPFMATLPWKMKWVSKKEIFSIPVAGWLMYLSGHISIDRGSVTAMESLRKAHKYLRNAVPVMIFPEGTRSRHGQIKSFKKGAFVLAKEGDYHILPVAINGTFNLMKPDTWQLNFRGDLTLSVLPPIDSTRFESVDALMEHTHQVLKSELEKFGRPENDANH
jgi:1-acyl-sn-glycerol-3-phosphate acyltransferase